MRLGYMRFALPAELAHQDEDYLAASGTRPSRKRWLEVLKNVCSGRGNNCVNAFVLDAAESAQLQDIFSFSLRVGFTVSFSNATGGPDRLFLANSRDVGTAVRLLTHIGSV
jgi:hypothetical protein